MRKKSLGENDEVIIRSLIELDNEATGAEVRRLIIEKTSRRPTVGAFYSAIDGLLAKEFLQVKRIEEGTAETGYRPQRILEVTTGGRQAVIDLEIERRAFESSYGLLLPNPRVATSKAKI